MSSPPVDPKPVIGHRDLVTQHRRCGADGIATQWRGHVGTDSPSLWSSCVSNNTNVSQTPSQWRARTSSGDETDDGIDCPTVWVGTTDSPPNVTIGEVEETINALGGDGSAKTSKSLRESMLSAVSGPRASVAQARNIIENVLGDYPVKEGEPERSDQPAYHHHSRHSLRGKTSAAKITRTAHDVAEAAIEQPQRKRDRRGHIITDHKTSSAITGAPMAGEHQGDTEEGEEESSSSTDSRAPSLAGAAHANGTTHRSHSDHDSLARQRRIAFLNAPITADKGTMLHAAARDGQLAIVAELVKVVGCDVNSVDALDRTPLHCAACNWGSGLEIAKVLVDAGTDIRSEDKNGQTAEQVAEAHRNTEIGTFLRREKRNRWPKRRLSM